MTSAQKYNDKMDKIFEDAKKNNVKYAPLHAVILLERLVNQIENENLTGIRETIKYAKEVIKQAKENLKFL
jgi:hypothetical protein